MLLWGAIGDDRARRVGLVRPAVAGARRDPRDRDRRRTSSRSSARSGPTRRASSRTRCSTTSRRRTSSPARRTSPGWASWRSWRSSRSPGRRSSSRGATSRPRADRHRPAVVHKVDRATAGASTIGCPRTLSPSCLVRAPDRATTERASNISIGPSGRCLVRSMDHEPSPRADQARLEPPPGGLDRPIAPPREVVRGADPRGERDPGVGVVALPPAPQQQPDEDREVGAGIVEEATGAAVALEDRRRPAAAGR